MSPAFHSNCSSEWPHLCAQRHTIEKNMHPKPIEALWPQVRERGGGRGRWREAGNREGEKKLREGKGKELKITINKKRGRKKDTTGRPSQLTSSLSVSSFSLDSRSHLSDTNINTSFCTDQQTPCSQDGQEVGQRTQFSLKNTQYRDESATMPS